MVWYLQMIIYFYFNNIPPFLRTELFQSHITQCPFNMSVSALSVAILRQLFLNTRHFSGNYSNPVAHIPLTCLFITIHSDLYHVDWYNPSSVALTQVKHFPNDDTCVDLHLKSTVSKSHSLKYVLTPIAFMCLEKGNCIGFSSSKYYNR